MTKLNDIVAAASLATGVPIDMILNARVGAGDARAAVVRELVMWVAAEIHQVEVWEIAALMRRPKGAVVAGIKHIDRLKDVSVDVRQVLSEIILAIDRLEADTVRQTIRKYRELGATIGSISRFLGIPKEQVALVLGISWNGGRQ